MICWIFLAALTPAARSGTNVLLAEPDLVSLGPLGWHAPEFAPPAAVAPGLPPVDPQDGDPGSILLRRLTARGVAGGFDGILYENRDRGHSTIAASLFPRLQHLVFDQALKEQNLDYGLAGQIVLPVIVFGNSSTAMTSGPAARSQPRLAMTSPLGPQRAFLTYTNDQIYVYPEHRDHDSDDRFPANWPYMIISQGSSGSDGPFLKAIALTLAALPADTKEFLLDHGLVAPTAQMILRRSLSHVYNRAAYLSGSAHPVVFQKDLLAPERMVALAAGMQPSDVPPMVRLKLESETFSDTSGLADLSEKLFDTPSAIARVWRGLGYRNEMTVSAENTSDPNERDLTFSWIVLQGDPQKVTIKPLDDKGAKARISIDWHDPWRTGPPENRQLNRVDVGVFAWNGVHDSAPAIISISFPSHQNRQYIAGSDDKLLISSVDYGADGRDAYFDPWLHWQAGWQDEFQYDADGGIAEWVRRLPDRDMTLIDRGAPAAIKLPVLQMTADNKIPTLVMRDPAMPTD